MQGRANSDKMKELTLSIPNMSSFSAILLGKTIIIWPDLGEKKEKKKMCSKTIWNMASHVLSLNMNPS